MDTAVALTKPHPPKLHATIARDSEGLGLVSETERVHQNHPLELGTRIALARLSVGVWLSSKKSVISILEQFKRNRRQPTVQSAASRLGRQQGQLGFPADDPTPDHPHQDVDTSFQRNGNDCKLLILPFVPPSLMNDNGSDLNEFCFETARFRNLGAATRSFGTSPTPAGAKACSAAAATMEGLLSPPRTSNSISRHLDPWRVLLDLS